MPSRWLDFFKRKRKNRTQTEPQPQPRGEKSEITEQASAGLATQLAKARAEVDDLKSRLSQADETMDRLNNVVTDYLNKHQDIIQLIYILKSENSEMAYQLDIQDCLRTHALERMSDESNALSKWLESENRQLRNTDEINAILNDALQEKNEDNYKKGMQFLKHKILRSKRSIQ